MKRIIALAVCLMLLSCSHNQAVPTTESGGPKTHVLTWPDYDGDFKNIESATYTLDGKPLGRGHAGYAALVEHVKHFPIGSKLILRYATTSGRGGEQGYALPLSRESSEIYDLMEERHIELQVPGGAWI